MATSLQFAFKVGGRVGSLEDLLEFCKPLGKEISKDLLYVTIKAAALKAATISDFTSTYKKKVRIAEAQIPKCRKKV